MSDDIELAGIDGSGRANGGRIEPPVDGYKALPNIDNSYVIPKSVWEELGGWQSVKSLYLGEWKTDGPDGDPHWETEAPGTWELPDGDDDSDRG
jgi:hypothetical protein